MIRLFSLSVFICLMGGCESDSESHGDNSKVAAQTAVRPLRIPTVEEEENPQPSDRPAPFQRAELPLTAFWLKALSKSESMPYLQGVKTRRRVHPRGTNLDRRVQLTISGAFPSTLTNRLLTALELPDIEKGLTGDPVTWKSRSWRLFTDTDTDQLIVEWHKKPAFGEKTRPRCYRPHHLEDVQMLDGAIGRTFRRTTTKRILETEEQLNLSHRATTVLVWYKNGFAQDEHMRHLQDALKKSAWTKDAGVSVKQRWSGRDEQSLSWRPVRTPYRMNCVLKGALIRFTWSRQR